MKISVLTIFPEFFGPALAEGMIRAAREKGALEVAIVPLRDFTDDTHRTTDDYPFGGGAGMIMKVEPIDRALTALAIGEPGPARGGRCAWCCCRRRGARFTQPRAIEFATLEHLVLVCGRYKGVDERVSDQLVDEELSLGDFVLSGGEPAALCVVDAIARLLPGVVGHVRFGRERLVPFRAARLGVLHAAGRVSRLDGAAGAALRAPRVRSRATAASKRCAAPSSGGPSCSSASN